MTIKTTHVGSLPRNHAVTDLVFARERGEPFDQARLSATVREAVFDAVQRQKEAGIDVVSDGEMSKISYATYVKDRYTGFEGDSPRNAPQDLKMFPSFLERLAKAGGTPNYARPCCVGPVAPADDAELRADISNLKDAMAEHGVAEGFMNAASPGVVALFLPDRHYGDRSAYLEALADAMAAEYRAIVEAGLYLQVDCPDLALSRHMLFASESDEAFVEIAGEQVAALNRALDGLPEDRVRVHICWGNYEGPHVCDIAMDKVFSTLMSVDAGTVLFETANPRHAHEWIVFRDRAAELPAGKILCPGVIDTTTNFVEHPEVVAQRLERFTHVFGEARVMAGTDCGMSTFAGFGAVDPEIAWAKLATLAEGARIAAGRA